MPPRRSAAQGSATRAGFDTTPPRAVAHARRNPSPPATNDLDKNDSGPRMTPHASLERLTAALAAAGLLTLAACGGGGGSTTSDTGAAGATTPTPVATSVTFTGVAATGAPLSGAAIRIKDRTGAVVCDTVADAEGRYRCGLGAGPKPPFVITATLDQTSLTSMAAEATRGTLNVTPLTHLIAARLASNGDPGQLAADIQASPGAVDKTKLEAAVAAMMAVLRPVLDALGEQTHPLTGSFRADGTGHDKLLDALQVSVRPSGDRSNIEITVRTLPTSEHDAPVKVSFTSADAAPAPITQTISPAQMGTDNIPVLLADMMRRMTACYALPQSDRVTNGELAGSALRADACRTLFVDNDPAGYLNNGARVGPGAAFGGMFRANGTGVVFDRPAFEFYRANGDLVFSYRWTSPAGAVDNEQLVARKVGTALKIVGNQYQYDARIRAWAQSREMINTPAFSHIDTGYNLYVSNRVNSLGNSVFSKVEVTTPRGNILTLEPQSGLSYLTLVNGGGQLTGTSVVRLNGRYVDPTTAGHPKDKETALFYADPVANSDEVIRAIPDHGVWRYEFFHADGVTPNVVQHYRTVSRAPTLGEVNAMPFVELTPAARADVVAMSSAKGLILFDKTPSADDPAFAPIAAPNGGDFWFVPSGALAPTSISLYGRAPQVSAPGVTPVVPGARFNDSMSVSTLARKASMPCSRQSAGDLHCDASFPNQFAVGSNVNAFEMWARNARQVEVSKLIGFYKLN